MILGEKLLPAVPIYVLVSVVPESFGGLTTAALQRSSAFADLDQRNIEVLTKSDEMIDPELRTRQLQEKGQISHKVNIRNVWFELERMSEDDLVKVSTELEPRVPSDDHTLESNGQRVVRRTAADGSVLQTDRFRRDGTCVISDRRDLAEKGKRGGRLVTLFTREGRAVAQWRSLKQMYQSWMDMVIGGEESILIIDSAPTGGLFYDYQRDNVTMVQCIHTHHLRQMHRDVRSKNTVDVMRLLTHLDWFDAVAVLTRGQNEDFIESGVIATNSVVLPNMLVDPPRGEAAGHDRSRGVIVGRHASVKRLDHALTAIAIAADTAPDLYVDLYGHGAQSDKLATLTEQLGLGARVTQHGYDPRGKEQFKNASFTILCSKYEGFGLVLLEAMFGGCIPIAYDIEFGPSDLITDGVDGFLVPDGDVDALAAAIAKLHAMDEKQVARMRRAAIRRAREFSPKNVTKRWGSTLAEVRERRRTLRESSTTAELTSICVSDVGVRVSAEVSGDGATEDCSVMVGWIGRGREAYGRVEAQARRYGNNLHVDATIDRNRLDAIEPGAVLDIYIDVLGEESWGRSRIASANSPMPEPHMGIAPYTTVGGSLSIGRVSPKR